MKIKSQKDFFSGLMFAASGAAFAAGSTHYTVGESARMGPGYFPLLLGVLLAAIGCGIVLESLLIETPDGDPVGAWHWKPMGFIVAANCAFGVLLAGLPSLGIPPMGLVVAIFALTFLSSLAGDEFKAGEVAVLAAVLAAGSYVAFIWLLRLQMPVWPSFLVS